MFLFVYTVTPDPNISDMEPPEDVISQSEHIQHIQSKYLSLRMRGGGDRQPIDKYSTTVPKLSAAGFMWNGQPSATLLHDIIHPLYMGLGSIQDRGSSLYECIKRIDKGGVLATPSRATCLASGNPQLIQDVEESKSRNRRAFCVIMNYTDSTCWHYKFFMKEFNTDGIDVITYMLTNLVLPFSTLEITNKSLYFSHMSMGKLNLPYTLAGYYQYLDKCIELGEELRKGSDDIVARFIDGLPEIASKIASDMRKDLAEGTYVFPATYGALTSRTFPTSFNTKVTPDAGHCDYWGMADSYRDEWIRLIKDVRSMTPKGFVREINDDPETQICDPGSSNMDTHHA